MKRKAGQKSCNIDPLNQAYFFFSCVCRCPIQSRTISTPTSERSTRFAGDWAKVPTASSGRGSTGMFSYFPLAINFYLQKNSGVQAATKNLDPWNRIGKRTTLLCYRKNWLPPPPSANTAIIAICLPSFGGSISA
jgi:hypothetical protein